MAHDLLLEKTRAERKAKHNITVEKLVCSVEDIPELRKEHIERIAKYRASHPEKVV